MDNLIELLTTRLSKSLPGYSAQKLMEPEMRNTFSFDKSTAKKAATLLGLYFDTEWKFNLIQRSSHPLDKHKGQISFPGGSIEKNESSEEAAVRETNEEIGIPVDKIKLIGALTPLYIPVSDFLVFPHAAFIDMDDVVMQKEEAEVEKILEVSVRELLDEGNQSKRTMPMPNGMQLRNVPVFSLADREVWGATAMMLSEFREIVKELIDDGDL